MFTGLTTLKSWVGSEFPVIGTLDANSTSERAQVGLSESGDAAQAWHRQPKKGGSTLEPPSRLRFGRVVDEGGGLAPYAGLLLDAP